MTGTIKGGLIASLANPFGQYNVGQYETPLVNSYWKAGVDPIGEINQSSVPSEIETAGFDPTFFMTECYSFTNPATGILPQAPSLYVMADGTFVTTTTTSLLDALRLFVALNHGYSFSEVQNSYEDWAAVSWQNGGYPIFDKDRQPEPLPEAKPTLPLTGDSLPAGFARFRWSLRLRVEHVCCFAEKYSTRRHN